jgi:hypothetical protein
VDEGNTLEVQGVAAVLQPSPATPAPVSVSSAAACASAPISPSRSAGPTQRASIGPSATSPGGAEAVASLAPPEYRVDVPSTPADGEDDGDGASKYQRRRPRSLARSLRFILFGALLLGLTFAGC